MAKPEPTFSACRSQPTLRQLDPLLASQSKPMLVGKGVLG